MCDFMLPVPITPAQFCCIHNCNDCNEISSITKIAIMKETLCASFMTVVVEVIDATGVQGGTSSDYTINLLPISVR